MTSSATTILDYVIVGSIFFILGTWGLVAGLRLRYGSIPYFVSDYNGWTSMSLGLPFGGIFMLGGSIVTFGPLLPTWVIQAISIPAFPSMVIFSSAIIIRFPKSLTPRWYRRALKAGIPRNDPYIMGKFKALDIETQKALIQLHKEHTARTKQRTKK